MGTARRARLADGSIPERVIQAQILAWLKEANVLHWRQNSGVVFAGNRMIRLGEEGLPDIVVIVPPGGRLLGLEVKSAKGSLRPSQEEFKARAEAAGAAFHVVRSLTQAKNAVAQTMGDEQWKRLPSLSGKDSSCKPN